MIGNFIGAAVGERLAGRNDGVKGALIGAAAPWLVRRALTPLGLLAIGAYGAKKLYDRRRARRSRTQVAAAPPPSSSAALLLLRHRRGHGDLRRGGLRLRRHRLHRTDRLSGTAGFGRIGLRRAAVGLRQRHPRRRRAAPSAGRAHRS